MRPNAIIAAIGQYLTSTTLHGFKYLYSPYVADRLAWLVCCCASATCAGVLCAVLWSRFTSVPNLLSLRTNDARVDMPRFGLCLPPNALARRIVRQEFGANYSDLAIPLGKTLLGEDSSEYKLAHLDFLFKSHNLTLRDALMRYSPGCDGVVLKCRVGGLMVDCGRFVEKELIPYGVCCVVDVLSLKQSPQDEPERTLELVIETPPDKYTFYDLYVRNQGKGWVLLTTLTPQHFYTGYLWFQYILGSETQHPAGGSSCQDDVGYSKTQCLRVCAETQCGCSDPLVKQTYRRKLCSIMTVACLRQAFIRAKFVSLQGPLISVSIRFGVERHGVREVTLLGDACNNACLPACEQVTTFISLEYVVMDALEYEIDPLYEGLVGSKAIVLSISLKSSGSQIFVRMPTETWLTLLSSLGGVFNMFLGVGLFSALELAYFLLVRLPIAIKKSREIEIISNADTNI